MKEKILVLFGGKSVEHDISIITTLQVAKNLPEQYSYVFVYMDKNGLWWTADNLNDSQTFINFKKFAKNRKQITILLGEKKILAKKRNKFVEFETFDGVLNCCHGNIGEDGSVQGIFKSCHTFQSCSSVTSMALCMDKAFMKDVFKSNGINSPKYICFNKCTYEKNKQSTLNQVQTKVGFPVVVKPANLGSSIGISVCKNKEEIEEAIQTAFEFDQKVLVEKLVDNLREFNCACFVYKGKLFSSSVNEVSNKSEIYTFQDKYLSENSSKQEAEKKLSRKIQKLTEKIYQIFDCQGIVRVDFLFDEKKQQLFANEINSIPGSLAFYLFKDLTFKEIITDIIEEAKFTFENQKNMVKIFDSDALKVFNSAMNNFKK